MFYHQKVARVQVFAEIQNFALRRHCGQRIPSDPNALTCGAAEHPAWGGGCPVDSVPPSHPRSLWTRLLIGAGAYGVAAYYIPPDQSEVGGDPTVLTRTAVGETSSRAAGQLQMSCILPQSWAGAQS